MLVLEGYMGGGETRVLQAGNRVYVDVARMQSRRTRGGRARISAGLTCRPGGA
jgi:hypothetical protein